jgi:hypothetical protein
MRTGSGTSTVTRPAHSSWAPRNEDEFSTRTIRRVAYLVGDEAHGDKGSDDLVLPPKAKRRVRCQDGAVGGESKCRSKGDKRQREVDQIDPVLHLANSGHVRSRERSRTIPLIPSSTCWIPGLKDEPSIRLQRSSNTSQSTVPSRFFNKRLCNVSGHHGHVDGIDEKIVSRAEHPPDTISARFTPGNSKRCLSRVNSGDLQTSQGHPTGERSGAAANVENRACVELVDDRFVVIEVASIRVQIVVDAGQPRHREVSIRHTTRYA